MKPTRLFILNGGSLAIDGYKVYWNRGPGGDIRFPVYSVLIDHEEGLFIYDTGFDLPHMQTYIPGDQPLQTPEQALPAQIAKAGFRPEDVTHVLSSHFHIDHCGGHEYFPQAVVVSHVNEYAHAMKPPLFERMSYSDLSFDPALECARDGLPPSATTYDRSPRYLLVRGDVEIASGVTLIETLGHSAGHYSLLVELAGQAPILFTGDAAMTPRNLEMMVIGSFHLDPIKATESLLRLKTVQAEHGAELFFSHSMPEFQTWKKAPEWY
ncbi:MAG: N-acyl homoserine lactonase family protein [Actinobacteria bacterium]|nr:N-acyl homoserine lactonase family protein [Actinomycetota bacterium]